MLIDSHAHLTSDQFDADREAVIKRATDAGVEYIINPATNLEDSRRAIELAERHSNVYACVGIHPHEAHHSTDARLKEIEELSKHPRVVAIGEIGLDYHYDFAPRDVQCDVFAAHLEIASRRDLPVVIHTRESIDDTMAVVGKAMAAHPSWRAHVSTPHHRYPGVKGVYHCFSGDTAAARAVIAQGFFISFPGMITFKNAQGAREVAGSTPVEYLLLETDSPYLAPVPHRGKRNEPSYVSLVASQLASLHRSTPEDIIRATGHNVFRLFGIGQLGPPRFTYRLKNSLYVNLTIRCNADCVFCDRRGAAVIKGYNLRIDREPEPEEIIDEIGDPRRYDEIVFCGYGEPTIRLDAIKRVAGGVKAKGGKTRLNTDGHGTVINKRDIVPELVGCIDAVSISLNSADPVQYGELMQIDHAIFFPAMVEFARQCVRLLPKTVLTIVDLPEVDKQYARTLADEVGAHLVIRPLFS